MVTNKRFILSLAAGLAVFGVGMLPALTAALAKQGTQQQEVLGKSNNRPHAVESVPCSPSPSQSPGE